MDYFFFTFPTCLSLWLKTWNIQRNVGVKIIKMTMIWSSIRFSHIIYMVAKLWIMMIYTNLKYKWNLNCDTSLFNRSIIYFYLFHLYTINPPFWVCPTYFKTILVNNMILIIENGTSAIRINTVNWYYWINKESKLKFKKSY